jgi:hypothetical protein
MNSAEIRSSLGIILTISLKLLLKLEELRESSVPGPGLGSMPDISNNMHSTHNRKVIMLA